MYICIFKYIYINNIYIYIYIMNLSLLLFLTRAHIPDTMNAVSLEKAMRNHGGR